jgi:hypothetical protein
LRRRGHVADIVDVEEAAGHCDDDVVVRHVETVDTLGRGRDGLLGRCRAGVPEAERAVP